MKHLLIILSILLLSSPVIGEETGELFKWETSSEVYQWKTFEDVDFHTKYKGEIRNGKPNGFGIMYFINGNKTVGEWKNGKEWNTKHHRKDGKLIEFYENGKKSGEKQWTKLLGTSHSECGDEVKTDSSGNIYVTGTTWGKFDGKNNSTYEDKEDIFLLKYNSSGEKQWIKQTGSPEIVWGESINIDSSDNIYVTGHTLGDLDGNTSSGSFDIVLIKYNSSGEKQWTKQFGTPWVDYGESVTTDSSGNIYVTGYTQGVFDGGENRGWEDVFLVKLDSSGEGKWTKQFGSIWNDQGKSVTTDSSGNIYVTGHTEKEFDGNKNIGKEDIFLVKFNSYGEKIWTKQWGTPHHDKGKSVTTDSSGNIYVVGDTKGGMDGNKNLGGRKDIFLVKFDSFGKRQWTKQWGSYSDDYGESVTVNKLGNIYVTGKKGTSGKDRNFLKKFNPSGGTKWNKRFGQYSSSTYGVTSDTTGNIYITGCTQNRLDGNNNLGRNDIFLMKFSW